MAPPKQLAKLDLDAERRKVGSSAPKPLISETPKTDKPNKPAKKAAAKVAVATQDQFSDLGEAGKPARPTRPASASVGGAKPPPSQAKPRPASASPTKSASGSPSKPASDSSSKPKPPPVKRAFGSKLSEAADAATDANLPAPSDDNEAPAKGEYDIFVQTRRCELLCLGLGLKLKHIRKMKKKFDDNDMYHSGEITQAEFFFILNEDRRPLTKGIFKYAGVTSDQKFMSFDEYLLCVVSFASLSPPEVYQFAFDLYDADGSGTLDERELAAMSQQLQSKQFSFPKNVATAIKRIEGNSDSPARVSEDGLVDLGEFMKFAKLAPLAFYPLFQFQKNVRRATLGQSKWSKVVARKLKVHEMVSHMRRNCGAIPELSLRARLWSIVDDEELEIRKHAAQLYAQELHQRRLIGD